MINTYPDLSSMSKKDRKKIAALHVLYPDEIDKIPVLDNKFYTGHVGFYTTKKQARLARLGGKLLETNLFIKSNGCLQKVLNNIIFLYLLR